MIMNLGKYALQRMKQEAAEMVWQKKLCTGRGRMGDSYLDEVGKANEIHASEV